MADDRQVALVTGSSSGIGAAVARALARARYAVVVNYSHNAGGARETVAACAAAGAETLLVQADVAAEAEVVAMMNRIRETFGRLDVVCSNAGMSIKVPPKAFDQIAVEEWDRVFAVNVRGLFLVAKHAKALLFEAPAPCMVNTASIVGLRPGAQPLPYSASKAAVISMTQTLAGALGPKVRVNAVAPGWMEGEWMQRMLADNYDKLMERRAKATPLGRCVTADDVAKVVLAIIERMPFVTGETIVVDGGFARTT
jgi:3-oxoacyl-[acyl-carrier protein] reductase